MNFVDGDIDGGGLQLSSAVRGPLPPHLTGLPQGKYRFGVRAGHIGLKPQSPMAVPFTTEAELAEISGSETFVHVRHNGDNWVSRLSGVHKFNPSTLSRAEQLKEIAWFIKAAEPYRGQEINVASETLTTHKYESQVLAKAFQEITGIKLKHDLIQEGDVIEKLQTQMQSGRNIYDAYVNDSDLIGTHFRYGKVVPLSGWMTGQGKAVTLPTLDVNDFIGKSFTTSPDGKLYQLPDQQFANLYWFRYDWFQRPDLKKKFKAIYGYELGVPVNWSAYEDIADFFTNKVKNLDGKRVYGHMDYGKKDPSLGWRFTDAWLSMAGAGDKGIPNGLPVDEWGIRVDQCRPVGSSVERGGATNGPAAVYSLTKYIDWLKQYAPPEAAGMTFSEAGPVHPRQNSPTKNRKVKLSTTMT